MQMLHSYFLGNQSPESKQEVPKLGLPHFL